jgi:hypothetical protein
MRCLQSSCWQAHTLGVCGQGEMRRITEPLASGEYRGLLLLQGEVSDQTKVLD